MSEQTTKSLAERIGHCVALLIVGFLLMAGAKIADWIFPDPPREPLKIEVVQKEGD